MCARKIDPRPYRRFGDYWRRGGERRRTGKRVAAYDLANATSEVKS